MTMTTLSVRSQTSREAQYGRFFGFSSFVITAASVLHVHPWPPRRPASEAPLGIPPVDDDLRHEGPARMAVTLAALAARHVEEWKAVLLLEAAGDEHPGEEVPRHEELRELRPGRTRMRLGHDQSFSAGCGAGFADLRKSSFPALQRRTAK